MRKIQEGEIYLAKFTPAYRSEIRKYRPALVLRAEANSLNPNLITVVPLTSLPGIKKENFEVALLKEKYPDLSKDSYFLCWYIRTIDKARLLSKIGKVDAKTLQSIKATSISYIKGQLNSQSQFYRL